MKKINATIANGAQTSGAIRIPPNQSGLSLLCGLSMPAAFTGTTMTFTVSTDAGTTFNALYDDTGTQISVTVAASRYIRLIPSLFAGIDHLKIVSGSAEGAARTVGLVFAEA